MSTTQQEISNPLREKLQATEVSTVQSRVLMMTNWTPWLAVWNGICLLSVLFGYTNAHHSILITDIFFWSGVLGIFLPSFYRLLDLRVKKGERLAILIVLGLSLYSVKWLHSPTEFTFFDELLHWRATDNILREGRLFTSNSLLPVSAGHPGLHNVTHALVSTSGVSIYVGGIMVIAIARIVQIGLMFFVYSKISRSPRIASLAVALYMTNPAFVFFNAQFAYESLALMFFVLALYFRVQLTKEGRLIWFVLFSLSVAAIIITHHLSAYMFLFLLAIWLVEPLLRQIIQDSVLWYAGLIRLFNFLKEVLQQAITIVKQIFFSHPEVGRVWLLVIAVVICLSWLTFASNSSVNYISSYVSAGLGEFRDLLHGLGGRQFFQSSSGEVAPKWEQYSSYIGILLTGIGILIGLIILYSRRRFHHSAAFVIAVFGILFPFSQVIRVTHLGLQVASRTVEFLYFGVAFLMAIAFAYAARKTLNRILIIGVLIPIIVSGITLGWPRWARYPGSYLVIADTRSIDVESKAAASWMLNELGPDNRIAADRINGLLMGSIGRQSLVTLAYDQIEIPSLYFAETWDFELEAMIHRAEIDYIVVDMRMTESLPVAGIYIELAEANANRHLAPIPQELLLKFEGQPSLNRVYDSGNIIIYAVEH